MKKQILFLFAIMMAVSSYGQPWKKAVREAAPKSTASQRVQKTVIAPAEGQFWWGYFTENDFELSDITVGIGSPTTLLTGISIPANHSLMGSATIKAVRIYLAEGIPSTVSDIKIWISRTLPASVEDADYFQDATGTLTVGANDFTLSTPYKVNNKAFYIGYSLTSSDNYPIRCGGTDQSGTFLICAPGALAWEDLNGYGFGKLAFQVLAEGVSLPDYSVSAADFETSYVLKGGTAHIPVTITNNGQQTVTSVSYTITTGSNTTAEQTVNVNNLSSFSTAKVDIPFEADDQPRKFAKTLTITKVNGQPNSSTSNTATGSLITISEKPVSVPVVEEFTGTWCGWCVYGYTGLEMAHQKFGDKVVLIAAHNGDPMAISDYDPIMSLVGGFPSSFVNRIDAPYPSADNLSYILTQRLNRFTVGTIQASAEWTSDEKKEISIDTQTKFVYSDDNGQYGIAYVLIEDGLTGTGSNWSQANYLSGESGDDPTMQFWYDSPSKVKGLEFNHVAVGAWGIASGINGSVKSTITADEVQNFNYKANISSKSVIQDKSKLTVAALLIDKSTGSIVNASQVAIQDYNPTAIHTVGTVTDASVVARYSLDGRQLSAPRKGLNIVKLSDGRTVKVQVK